ncbi:hypothetical protein AB0D12_17550 [Streptomyces sp. NPDC048479]|uniref:hypothetical protein n=1 Tax=Streptomyces sp. NPDC048479 TaxID=3154725 RepID=UPI0034309874
MRAAVLTRPVTAEQLTVTEVPVPRLRPGWVRVRVFGVNECRKGASDSDFTFPRILGIEGADAAPRAHDPSAESATN